jgi:HEAT repeat protein
MRRLIRLGLLGLVLVTSAARAVEFKDSVAILRGYQDHDEKDVLAAIERLAAGQDKRAIGPLSELLGLPPNRIKIVTAARQALLELGAMDVFGQKLKTGTLQERQETAETLGRMGSPAIDLLLPYLNDPAAELRSTVVVSLGVLAQATQDGRAVQGLVQALSDQSPYVQESAVLALANLGTAQATDALIGLLRKGQLVSQVGAAFARIAQANASAADGVVQALQPIMSDPDAPLVERVIGILRGLAVPQAKGPLIAALHHASPRIRFAAVHALISYKDDPAVQSAVQELSKTETDSLVRTTVASFLAGELNADQ